MPNVLDSNTSDLVLKGFLDSFKCDQVLTKTVDNQLIQGEINPQTGDTVRLKRPQQLRTERTTDGDLTSSTANDIIAGSALAKTREYITVELDYLQLEQALEMDELADMNGPAGELIRAAGSQMVTDLEIELAQYIKILHFSLVLLASRLVSGAMWQVAVLTLSQSVYQ